MKLALAAALCGLAVAAPPRFEASRLCSMCHSNIPAPGNDDTNVAPYALWLGGMKANSSRDPYWKAKVREEVAVNPAAAAVIEDTCLRCHAPSEQYPYRGRRSRMRFSDLEQQSEGVTCTVCHQIAAAGLGRKASFTAGFQIGGDEQIFGPHADPFAMPMLHHTGYEPVQSMHMLDSALCGSCHTVITPTLDANGKVVGEFVEQAPYLEWLASAYAREGRSCQSCHMPVLDAPSYIAHRPPGGPFPPTSPRTPFGRHTFAGANVRGAAMLADLLPDRAQLFQSAAAAASEMLAKALTLELKAVSRSGILEIAVDVKNLAGHKLPTAYPSRRLWLHFTAVDDAGKVVFESGSTKAPIKPQPHRDRIASPDQVMIYEAEHADIDGRPTVSLLRAARYVKDNRILPRGFDSKTALPDGMSSALIAPVGTGGDADFLPGSDRVVYVIPATAVRISVEALYQSIKPSHAQAAAASGTPESKTFGQLYGRYGDSVLAARAELRIAGAR